MDHKSDRPVIPHPYFSRGDGKCVCPALPTTLRRCKMNGTCALAKGERCETAVGAFWSSRLGLAAIPFATLISTVPVGCGGWRVSREKTHRRDAAGDEARVRAAYRAEAKSEEEASKPAGRAQGFAIVAARVLQGYHAAKAIAEVPAEPLQESEPTMKFSGLGCPKAGRRKAGFSTRRQWNKARRRKNTKAQGRQWVFTA